MYVYTCAKCGKSIDLSRGDCFRTETALVHGEWTEVKIHLFPVCGTQQQHPFQLIRGGRQ